MNIKQVKSQWDLEKLLAHLGHQPDKAKSKANDIWYCSPFRNEAEPSFHIDPRKDIWMDFGLNEARSGGDLIYFVQCLLKEEGKDNSISSVLEWFSELSGYAPTSIVREAPQRATVTKADKFKLLSVKPIFTQALFNYLEERKIDRQVGMRFLKQVYFQHRETGRKIFGLGMANSSQGYEIRSPHNFKGVVGNKAITVIKAGNTSTAVSIFEGTFDFLSRMTVLKRADRSFPEHDCIIMHTNRLFNDAAAVIRTGGYRTVQLWMDNDPGGEEGAKALMEALADMEGIAFDDMSANYDGHKDLNNWLVAEADPSP